MGHTKSDWTIKEVLDYLAEQYPGGQKTALHALWRAGREARLTISGCRCKWASHDPLEVGERENIASLALVDLALVWRGGDWAALAPNDEQALRGQERTYLVLGKNVHVAPAPLTGRVLLSKGWCRLRVRPEEIRSAFPKAVAAKP